MTQKLSARVEAGQIKALSIKQPWPHRIFHEGKDIENRDWPTKGRGWFIIHAGKTSEGIPSAYGQVPMGGIVGMARIVDCVDKSDSEWFFGKFGFVLADAFPVDLIPCKGALGFFNPPVEVMAALAAALKARGL